MTTISKSFTAKGVSDVLRLQEPQTVTFTLSGTYAASVQLERSVTPDESSWERVSPSYSVANASVTFLYQTRANEHLRVRCTARTSGTAVTTLADEDAVLRNERDNFNGLKFQILESGLVLKEALTVEGAVTAAAGVTAPITGAVNSAPIAETQSVDPSQKMTFFDDFLGDVLHDRWTAITGTDPQAVAAAIVAGTLNGVVAMTSGDSNPGVTAADAAGLVLGRHFRADQGGLVLEARVKLDDITTTKALVGFTDSIALEFPVISNGTTGITATADDAVGFLYDTLATTDVWSGFGVDSTVSAGAVKNGSAPVNDTYVTLRVEISSTGTATFYQDGTSLGSLAAAVSPDVLLTPILIVMENGVAAVRKLTCDYIWVQQNR